jgi:hypothetical protein
LLILVAASILVPPLLRRSGLAVDAGGSLQYLEARAAQMAELWRIPRLVWNEWLVPFLPVSLVLIALSFGRRCRSAAIAATAGGAAVLAIAWLIVRDLRLRVRRLHQRDHVARARRGRDQLPVAVGSRAMLAVALGHLGSAVSGAAGTGPHARVAEAVAKVVGDHAAFWLLGSQNDGEAWFHPLPSRRRGPALGPDDARADALRATLTRLEATIAEHRATRRSRVRDEHGLEVANSLGRRGAERAHAARLARAAARPGARARR